MRKTTINEFDVRFLEAKAEVAQQLRDVKDIVAHTETIKDQPLDH